ncbi:MAG: LPS export ABC transporter periplasmic protein LptC [Selenomonadaceae bacterium]|nr:LPS export ABC transporter periplasmic protein LptC [Selenomonadaceae bacterium]
MSTRSKILAAIVVIFFVCVGVWVVRTTPNEPPPQEKFDPPTVMEYEGNTITEEKDGVIIWELTCDKMRIDTITQNMELEGVHGKFYQHDPEKSWELTAKKGVYYQVDETVYVEGEVNVTNSDGAKLQSDRLEWFSKDEKLIATGNVKIAKDDMRAFGDTAYTDNNFKHFGLIGHAKVLKGVTDDEPTN